MANTNVAFPVPGFLPSLRPVTDALVVRGWPYDRRLYEITEGEFVYLCRARTYMALPAAIVIAQFTTARLVEEVRFLVRMNDGSPVL